MQPVSLFAFAAQQAQWLSARQATVAGNIANVNTPGYAAKDVEPFEAVLAKTGTGLARTHPQHVSLGIAEGRFAVAETDAGGADLPSGNTVELEGELMKAGEVRRGMELNTGIVGAFHRMYLMTARGG